MTTAAKPTRKRAPAKQTLLTINDVAQKLDMSYHEARNFLVRVPVAKTGDRGAHLYALEAVTAAHKTTASQSGNEAQPGTKEWHEVEKIRRQVEKLDVELEGIRGKVLDRDEVKRETMALCMEFAKHLDEMESKLAPMVAGLTPTEAQPVIMQYNAKLRETLRNAKP
jgi:hypothetical protein